MVGWEWAPRTCTLDWYPIGHVALGMYPHESWGYKAYLLSTYLRSVQVQEEGGVLPQLGGLSWNWRSLWLTMWAVFS